MRFISGINSRASQKFMSMIRRLPVINRASACAHVLEGVGQSHVITKPHRWEYMWEDLSGISTAACTALTPYLVLQGFYSASLAKFPVQCVHPVDRAWKKPLQTLWTVCFTLLGQVLFNNIDTFFMLSLPGVYNKPKKNPTFFFCLKFLGLRLVL